MEARAIPAYQLRGPNYRSFQSDLFFAPGCGRDACQIIGSRLSLNELKKLALVSKAANYSFARPLNYLHDAHVILQIIMNHPTEIENVLQEAKALYGENFWQLLLLNVPATEEHCRRHHPSMSAIKFAAISGNFYQYLYELAPMPAHEDAVLEQGKFYAAEQSLGNDEVMLTYAVVNPDGEVVKNFILEEQFADVFITERTLENAKAFLLAIMAITYERGETNDVNPYDPDIAKTYLLNSLFAEIPDEHRGEAIAQLEELPAIMTDCKELIAGYNYYVEQFIYRDWDERDEEFLASLGVTQKLLHWHTLRMLCEEASWEQMADFNRMRAPAGEPMISYCAATGRVPLASCIKVIGISCAIHHDSTGAFGMMRLMRGDAITASNTLTRYDHVKSMQFAAFIAWQKLLDEKYQAKAKNDNVPLRERNLLQM